MLTPKRNGYSLIEILFCLALISIVSAYGAHALSQFLREKESMLLAHELLKAIHAAADYTRIHHMPLSLCQTDATLQCEQRDSDRLLLFVDQNAQGKLFDKADVIAVQQLNLRGGQLKWHFYPHYREHLHFTSRNSLTADNGTLWYCAASSNIPSFAIVVDAHANTRLLNASPHQRLEDSEGRALSC